MSDSDEANEAHKRENKKGFCIWSIENHAWWMPGRGGYTTAASRAGIYTHDEAYEICKDANLTELNEVMVPMSCYTNDKLPERRR